MKGYVLIEILYDEDGFLSYIDPLYTSAKEKYVLGFLNKVKAAFINDGNINDYTIVDEEKSLLTVKYNDGRLRIFDIYETPIID